MTLDAHVVVSAGDFALDVDLRAEAGEVLALMGPNGAGKTTALRAIAGLVPLDAGRIVVNGVALDDPASQVFVPAEDRHVGVVFQSYLLFEHLSVLDNVAFGPRSRGASRRDARRVAAEWLGRIGLTDLATVRPGRLSGGQAQRVAIARALATQPNVLLLDEPLAALDASTRQTVRRDLRRHLEEFTGVSLLVTHDPVDAYALADRVVILDAGRIIQVGTLPDVAAHPRSAYVAELVGTNLVSGVVRDNRLQTATGATVVTVGATDGPNFAVIRPQAVTLSRHRVDDVSSRNAWRGTVTDIDQLGERVRVSLSGDLPIAAEITLDALDALDIRPGDDVIASVKATDIRTFES